MSPRVTVDSTSVFLIGYGQLEGSSLITMQLAMPSSHVSLHYKLLVQYIILAGHD